MSEGRIPPTLSGVVGHMPCRYRQVVPVRARLQHVSSFGDHPPGRTQHRPSLHGTPKQQSATDLHALCARTQHRVLLPL
jgi:hypothetical protein